MNPAPPRGGQQSCARWLRAWVWALIAVMPWAGMAGAQREMFGPLHAHHAGLSHFRQGLVERLRALIQAPQHPHGLSVLHVRDVRDVRDVQYTRLTTRASQSGTVHDHSSAQRHHHGSDDDSVQALDGPSAEAATPVSPLMAGQAQGLPCLRWLAPADEVPVWCAPHVAEFSAPPPLRPPRA